MKFTLLLIFVIINLSYSIYSEEQLIWSKLRGFDFTEAGITSLIEKSLWWILNEKWYLDIAYHLKFGSTDSEYVGQVKSGKYAKETFVNDNIRFGLAQWRDKTRKQ